MARSREPRATRPDHENASLLLFSAWKARRAFTVWMLGWRETQRRPVDLLWSGSTALFRQSCYVLCRQLRPNVGC